MIEMTWFDFAVLVLFCWALCLWVLDGWRFYRMLQRRADEAPQGPQKGREQS